MALMATSERWNWAEISFHEILSGLSRMVWRMAAFSSSVHRFVVFLGGGVSAGGAGGAGGTGRAGGAGGIERFAATGRFITRGCLTVAGGCSFF